MSATGRPISQSHSPEPEPSRRREYGLADYAVAGLVAVYLTGSLLGWVWILGDGATGSFHLLKWLRIPLPTDSKVIDILKVAYFAGVGGGVGGVTFGMMNLQRHVTSGTFKAVYSGDYLFRPLGAAALALVVFSLARGGVLTILGADPTAGSDTIASKLASLGVGFLVGFASLQVVQFLTNLASNTFEPKKSV